MCALLRAGGQAHPPTYLEEGLDLPDELPYGPQRIPSAQFEQRMRRHCRGSEASEVGADNLNARGVERVEAALEADDQLASAELVPTLHLLHILCGGRVWNEQRKGRVEDTCEEGELREGQYLAKISIRHKYCTL
jgi:hypothetical protein